MEDHEIAVQLYETLMIEALERGDDSSISRAGALADLPRDSKIAGWAVLQDLVKLGLVEETPGEVCTFYRLLNQDRDSFTAAYFDMYWRREEAEQKARNEAAAGVLDMLMGID